MRKTKSTPALLRQAKARATLQVAGKLLWVWCSGGGVVGLLGWALGAGVFGMGGLHAFGIGFIGWIVFISVLIPPIDGWLPIYRRICLDEGLWDELDRMTFERAGPGIFELFEGREPQPFIRDRDALFFVHLALVDRGEPRKSARVIEFMIKLIRAEMASHGISEDATAPRKRFGGLLSHLPGGPNFEDEPKSSMLPFALLHTEAMLADCCLALGRYDESITLMHKRLADIERNPVDPFPHAKALFVLIEALLQVHRLEEARGSMLVARRVLDTAVAGHPAPVASSAQSAGKTVTQSVTADQAGFAGDLEPGVWPEWLGSLEGTYCLLLARLEGLSGKTGTERLLERAEKLLQQRQNQEDHLLLLADIQLELAFLALQQGDLARAETWTRNCLSYFDSETRYTGPRFRMAQATLAYVRLKRGSNEPVTREIEAPLEALRAEIEENHPDIATCLSWLAESHVRDSRRDLAREALDHALKIRRAIFPENDPQIRETQRLIATVA